MNANRQQWCGIVGWTTRQFDRNVALGFPAKKKTGSRGDTWSIDTVQGVAWLVARVAVDGGGEASPDANAERARLLRSQANISEPEEGKLRGELLPADQVVEGWEMLLSRSRALLLSIPHHAPELIVLAAQGPSPVRERLTDLVHDALTELSRTELDDLDEDGEDNAPGAALAGG